MMNKWVKKLWVEALRSDEYKQGRTWLRQSDASGAYHCCLGVLCELFSVETGRGKWASNHSAWQHFEVGNYSSASVLPAPVMDWAGLGDCNPRLGRTKVASVLNDEGKDFDFIADRIEKYL